MMPSLELHCFCKTVVEVVFLYMQKFFENVNPRFFKDFVAASDELVQVLHDDDKTELQESLRALQERWHEIHAHAPVRLVKLNFQAPEVDFLQLLSRAEQALSDEEAALQEKASVKDILSAHQVSDVKDILSENQVSVKDIFNTDTVNTQSASVGFSTQLKIMLGAGARSVL